MKSLILETRNLTVGYAKQNVAMPVASNININIQPGRLVCIIGANGVGKSTLLRTISGLQAKLSGEITIDGNEISVINPSNLAKYMSVVLTDRIPTGNMTVRELISIGRQPYTNWIGKLNADDHLKIDDAISMTDIAHLSNRKFYEISDGQLQAVLIARALAQDTPMIVLDEPSTHLDLVHKASLFRLLRTLAHDHRKAVLFSTHDIELAIRACDEVIVMTDERVIQEDVDSFIANKTFDRIFADSGISFDANNFKFNFDGLRQ